MKKFMTRCCAITAMMVLLTSCSKEEDTPEPQQPDPTPIVVDTQDCSTLTLCLTDDWKLDSIIYTNNGAPVMTGMPSNGTVGMILNSDCQKSM